MKSAREKRWRTLAGKEQFCHKSFQRTSRRHVLRPSNKYLHLAIYTIQSDDYRKLFYIEIDFFRFDHRVAFCRLKCISLMTKFLKSNLIIKEHVFFFEFLYCCIFLFWRKRGNRNARVVLYTFHEFVDT